MTLYNNSDLQSALNQQHQADLRRQAENYRLAQQAQPRNSHNGTQNAIYGPVLAQLGSVLMRVGTNLQARYGDHFDAETPLKADAASQPA